MDSRERFLTALRNRIPDRVPVAPDVSNYIPARRTGLPFWDIYFFGRKPLWEAYLETADHYGFDPWIASLLGFWGEPANPRFEERVHYEFDAKEQAMIRVSVFRTPDGDLTRRDLCFSAEPPSPVEKPIKNLVADFAKFRHLAFGERRYDASRLAPMREACRKRNAAFGVSIGYPGFHSFFGCCQGGLEDLVETELEHPEILEEWAERNSADQIECAEFLLREGNLDYLMLGGSGTLTLASPELVMKYAIPTIRAITERAEKAGVPTLLHSCGRSRVLIDLLCDHTRLGCLNPLEVPPMGDVDLAEVKRSRGSRLALMGNLHTTDVMLKGTPGEVERAAVRAMRDAGERGGFILSTGDQCGRETPEENLFTIVEAARRYGTYDSSGRLPDLPDLP